MKFQVSDGEKYQKIMEVEISVEELAQAMYQAGKRLAAQVNIPGFRKGKAPQSIIENFLGVDTILSEAADKIVPQAYNQGLKELNLSPVEQPRIEMVRIIAKEPLIFKATFTTKPQVKLGQYQGLPITKQVSEVKQAEIDADIEMQRRRLSRLTEAEEDTEAALNDVLSIDFEGFLEGEPFEGGKGENYTLELGSHSFVAGFEEQLIGAKAGEEREINLTFPEDYQKAALAGQTVMFKVKVQVLKRRFWPDLDDEFAQEVSETAETMEDLHREVTERLQQQHSEAAESQARKDAIIQATTNAEIDLPPLMIEQRIDGMVQSMAENLQVRGLQVEQFLQHTGRTAQELRESYHEQAEKAVRNDLVLEAVAKVENISVSEEEVERELQILSNYYHQTPEQIKETLNEANRFDALIEDIRMNKAADLIHNSAVITEVIISSEEVEEAGEIIDADL
jgi:trigger factor